MIEGKLISIATRRSSRATMVEFESIQVTQDKGCVGDFRGRPGDRQVTVLASEDWLAACDELGKSLPWTTRRANLQIEGIDLFETSGATLQIGDVVLKVTGETDPCQRMEQAAKGLFRALMPRWRGGVCCRVIQGGTIRIGDSVQLETS